MATLAVWAIETLVKHERWTSLLRNWLVFEFKMGYPQGQVCNNYYVYLGYALMFFKSKRLFLRNKHWPEILSHWIKDHHKWGLMPDIMDQCKSFAEDFFKWWQGLQPAWWLMASLELCEDIPENFVEWKELAKGGPNGVFLLILALAWWGASIQGSDTEHSDEEFNTALYQVSWLLQYFLDIIKDLGINITQMTLKQKWGESDGNANALKRYFLFICSKTMIFDNVKLELTKLNSFDIYIWIYLFWYLIFCWITFSMLWFMPRGWPMQDFSYLFYSLCSWPSRSVSQVPNHWSMSDFSGQPSHFIARQCGWEDPGNLLTAINYVSTNSWGIINYGQW